MPGFGIMSRYRKSSDIKAYVGMIRYVDVKMSGYRGIQISKRPDIEASGYQNMPFDALISGYLETGLPTKLYGADSAKLSLFMFY